MTYQSLAFFTGLFGSLHCVAMCGPLVMALPFPGNVWQSLLNKTIYQLGRILTYSALGLLAGSVGGLFNILGLQQALSFVSGVLLLGIAFYHFTGRKALQANRLYDKLLSPIVAFMGRGLSKPYGGLFAGMLHGLIPCGMVYMAIAGSLNAGSAINGSEFMFYFGLGTTPLLVLASIVPLVFKKIRAPRLLIPVLFVFAGSLLIVRALNVEVPGIGMSSMVTSGNEAPVCK